MKLDKTNVCVFIEDESQLQQARELLERYGEEIAQDGCFAFFEDSKNYLGSWLDGSWYSASRILRGKTQITLSELEEILKGEKDER